MIDHSKRRKKYQKTDMRVQLKKKREKVRIANFISAKCLPNAAGGLGGAVSPPAGPGLSPGGGQGAKAPRKCCVFSSKNALDWLILSQLLPLILSMIIAFNCRIISHSH